AGAGTIGGTLAANLSGPRRIKAGAARDHFLGFSAVSGRGETFKSGGRGVKNVTGYDLCKLIAGSGGTLGAMTGGAVTGLRRRVAEETVAVLGLDDRAAIAAMSSAMGSAADVSGAAHLPAPVAATVAGRAAGPRGVTALRIEGVPPSLAHRRGILENLLKPHGTLVNLAERESGQFWQQGRDVGPCPAASEVGERPLWRISTAPMQGPDLVRMIGTEADAAFLYDWAGGLIWAALAPADDAGALRVRRAVAACGGHATLIRAP